MAWEQIVYRDIWARDLRLIVNGRDVTYFRDVPTQVGGYQLQEPFGYGPADFQFPQITELEVDQFGVHGSGLGWLKQGGVWELRPVRSDDNYGPAVWRGFASVLQVSDHAVQVHCDGEASGRLALRDCHPAVFEYTKDIGRHCWSVFNRLGLRLRPFPGPDTGITVSNLNGTSGTWLDWVNQLLAGTTTRDGNQWTIMPAGGGAYEMALKDLTTVHATVFVGTEGVSLDLSDDMQERPTTIYGTGTAPNGQKWINPIAPNLTSGEPAPYPFADGRTFGEGTTNADTDSGGGITVMNQKLIGMGLMTLDETSPTWDADTTDAVEELQDRAGVPVTGTMDQATWDALFNNAANGMTLVQAEVLPLAQLGSTRKWNRTSNGSLASRNLGFDEDAIEVDLTVDHGSGVRKAWARSWSKSTLKRLHQGKNWVGTVELGVDVFAGNVHHTDDTKTLMSRLELAPGMNLMLRHFDGDTLVHISGVNVDSDRSVRLAVDSQARDLLTVGQIIARNKETRRNPAREWLNDFRRGPAFDNRIIFSEIGGILDQDVALTGNTWNVFPVIAGQEGTIERLRLAVSPAAAFCCGVFGFRVGDGMLNAKVGNPFDVDADGETNWTNPDLQQWLHDEHILLYAAGDKDQPCGYWPKKHTNAMGKVTTNPLTGEWQDRAGFDYRTFSADVGGVPVRGDLFIAVYPDRDCTVQAGRVLWPLQTEGA